MTTERPEQRVGIFIDVQNIYHSAKNLYRSRVNFMELVKFITADRFLIRAFAYVVKSEGIVVQDPELHIDGRATEGSFFEALKKAGLELRLKDLQIYPGGSKKADWDVGMAVDAIRTADSLDVVTLVTGDGDFVPLVEYLKWGLGKRVEVVAFSRTTSGRLRDVADSFIEVENIPKILLKIRNQRQIKRTNKK